MIIENLSDKTYEMRMTKNPITNSLQSPMPTGKSIDELDTRKADYKMKKDEILNHPNYSTSEMVYLRPGINKFENKEHAEYFYKQLGSPEVAGGVPIGAGKWAQVTNRNHVLEVEETEKKGEYKETKENFFRKYRMPSGVQMVNQVDKDLFKLEKE